MAVTPVRLLTQQGLIDNPIVALAQIIRTETGKLGFSAYEASIDIKVSKTGIKAYEELLSDTQKFVARNGIIKFAGNSQYPFTAADATDTSSRFSPDTITDSSMKSVSQELDDAPDDGAGHVTQDQGVLKVTQQRANQQISSDAQILDGNDKILDGIIDDRLKNFRCIELIWSYWMEQAMLVQGMNAITARYQNKRPVGPDPLARCDISYLRPLSNLLWGYIQKEPDRLSLPRRAYEYDHHYGLRLSGSAVPVLQPADSRTRFLDAFHRLLYQCSRFFTISMNTTMQADAFPVLHALKELALLLEEGMHNQYGELPIAAREEMLMQQFFLNLPEIKEFLGGRANVTFNEPWMAQLDTLRTIMGWNDASVRHYYELATFGEQILLSVRTWTWSTENNDAVASAWLQSWRPELQGYIHSYRAVTGVDLSANQTQLVSANVNTAQPSDLIMRRRAGMIPNGRM